MRLVFVRSKSSPLTSTKKLFLVVGRLFDFKKNLFSKGPLNISLPVTVFNCRSQLSQYAHAFSQSPRYLEEAAKLKDPV